MKKKTRGLLLFFIAIIFVTALSTAVLLSIKISAFAHSAENYSDSILYDENFANIIEKDCVIVTLTQKETKKFHNDLRSDKI